MATKKKPLVIAAKDGMEFRKLGNNWALWVQENGHWKGKGNFPSLKALLENLVQKKPELLLGELEGSLTPAQFLRRLDETLVEMDALLASRQA